MSSSDENAKSTGTGAAVGAATGGIAGGAAAGAAVGGMTGPVGAAVGAAVGLGVGAVGGKAASDSSSTDAGGLGDSSSMHTVIGAFDDTSTAQRAVERLVQAGFDRSDVHLEHQGSAIGGTTGGTTGARSPSDYPEVRTGEKVGGFFASLFGMDDADEGGKRNQYADHAYTFDEAARRGSPVVVVDARDERQADEASSLLHELGAIDVDERANQWRAEGWQPPGAGQRESLTAGQSTAADKQQVLEVVEEELQVGKRTLNRGGVRVVQRVSAKPVREVIRLREEHAVVERREVDRPATAADLFKEESFEVRETAEEAVVAKSARVVEEVHVGKEVRDREKAIEETVRRKDVDVERLEGHSNTEAREGAVAANPSAGRAGDLGRSDKP